MKKIIALLILGSVFTAATPAQAATVKPGVACKTVSAKTTIYANSSANKGKTYTCVMSKGKLVYGPAQDAFRIKTLLNVNQVWVGNSVSLSLTDSLGNDCGADFAKVGSECYGFYLGWNANFDDASRVVDYSKIEVTRISGLQIGDSGSFQLKYQDPTSQSSQVIIVKTYPFNYNY